MNYYEIVYIVHPALQAGHFDDIVNKINDKIEKLKGDVLYFENWGKKKLSYIIQKQRYGTYVLMQCKINGSVMNDLNSDFELNSNILRHLITNIHAEDVLKESNIKNKDINEKTTTEIKKNIKEQLSSENKEKRESTKNDKSDETNENIEDNAENNDEKKVESKEDNVENN